jgi:hypothetical protein
VIQKQAIVKKERFLSFFEEDLNFHFLKVCHTFLWLVEQKKDKIFLVDFTLIFYQGKFLPKKNILLGLLC